MSQPSTNPIRADQAPHPTQPETNPPSTSGVCSGCGHEHAGERLGGICIGCPCEVREAEAIDLGWSEGEVVL